MDVGAVKAPTTRRSQICKRSGRSVSILLTPTDIASLARSHTLTAIRTLAQIMKQPEAPYAARVAAAVALLDRGWGKPKQSHEAEITHRYVIEIPALQDNAEWEAEGLGRL